MIAAASNLAHINVGNLVKEKGLHDGFDEKFQSYYIDEDKVCDELEILVKDGDCVVDYHGCDFFPERWFDLIVVLETDNSVLYPRLEARGYSAEKISENISCEVFGIVKEEALNAYPPERVVCLRSETVDDIESNVERILEWTRQFNQSI